MKKKLMLLTLLLILHTCKTTLATSIDLPTSDAKIGLLGFYFESENYNNLITITPTEKDSLGFDNTDSQSLIPQSQKFNSFKFKGNLLLDKTTSGILVLGNANDASIQINGRTISTTENDNEIITIKENELTSIEISYSTSTSMTIEDLSKLQLKIIGSSNEEDIIINTDQLRLPSLNKVKSNLKFRDNNNKNNRSLGFDEFSDTDGDNIPDLWEIEGYTVQRKKIVKWHESYQELGYVKYRSNPLEAHTAGDPYNDYEKAANDMPATTSKEARNPLVAAFPSVNVSLEKLILSKNANMTDSVSSHNSTNWSYTNTEGAEIGSKWSILEGFSVNVSLNYQHSETVANEWGSSADKSIHINEAETAYLNANIRYRNSGTAAIYDTKPTTSFVLDGKTIGTIKAKENTTALSIPPSQTYPPASSNGIALNTMDDFASRPIPLNKQQYDTFVYNNKPIILQTNQVEGKYATKTINGNIQIAGDWNGIIDQIKNRTASIMLDLGSQMPEKRVAAKDYSNVEDYTPELTLKEAIVLAFPDDVTEQKGLLYYRETPIHEESIQSFIDPYTADLIEKQISSTNGVFKDVTTLYDVKLEPKMNFTLKTSTLHDGGEKGDLNENIIGTWNNTTLVSNKDVNVYSGENAFYSKSNAYIDLKKSAIETLKKDKNYYITTFLRSTNNKSGNLSLEVFDVHGLSLAKDTLKIAKDNDYQKYSLLVPNDTNNEIGSVHFSSSQGLEFKWDDLSFNETNDNAIKSDEHYDAFDYSDEELWNDYNRVAQIHKVASSSNDFEKITFFGVNNIMNDSVESYRIKYSVLSNGKNSSFNTKSKKFLIDDLGSVSLFFSDFNDNKNLIRHSRTKDKLDIYVILKNGREVHICTRNF